MKPALFEDAALFEHRFWLQILGDHSRFIFNSLSPKETGEINRAAGFINTFDGLLSEARQELSGPLLSALTEKAYNSTVMLRNFKLHLLRRSLTNSLAAHLPPTFFNHMLNELDEYLNVLSILSSGRAIAENPVHYHLLWLLDGSGHASSIGSNLDEAEKDLIKESKMFDRIFMDLYSKAEEMAGYMRTGLDRFPSLDRLNRQADEKMRLFMVFLNGLKEKRLNKEVLGTLMPLMADHMYREECYYLTKLSLVSDIKKPDCDPGEPRIEA